MHGYYIVVETVNLRIVREYKAVFKRIVQYFMQLSQMEGS